MAHPEGYILVPPIPLGGQFGGSHLGAREQEIHPTGRGRSVGLFVLPLLEVEAAAAGLLRGGPLRRARRP